MVSKLPTHEILSVVAYSRDIGHPDLRHRRITAGLNRLTVRYVGSSDHQQEFEKIFFCSLALTADVYLVADNEEICDEYIDRCEKDNVFFDSQVNAPQEIWPYVLSPEAKSRLRAWQRCAAGCGIESYFCDVKDRPRGATPKECLPTQLPGTMMFSPKRNGLMTSKELLAVQGLHMYPHQDGSFVSGFTNVFDRLTPAQRQRLAGGSLNAALYSAFVWFVLSNTVPVEQVEPRSFAMCDVSSDEEDGTQDDPHADTQCE